MGNDRLTFLTFDWLKMTNAKPVVNRLLDQNVPNIYKVMFLSSFIILFINKLYDSTLEENKQTITVLFIYLFKYTNEITNIYSMNVYKHYLKWNSK